MALTATQAQALRDEIANDPKARGYAAHLPDSPGMVVVLLNAVPAADADLVIKPIRATTAQAWAATGPMAAIVDCSTKAAHACRASCLLVLAALNAGTDMHMEAPDVKALFASWVYGDVIDQAQHDSLFDRARQPVSRAEFLGLGIPTIYDLVDAGIIQ